MRYVASKQWFVINSVHCFCVCPGRGGMSLKPKRVNFDETWKDLSATLESIMCGNKVDSTPWKDRFRLKCASSVD